MSVKMHSLVWKQLEMPKEMEREREDNELLRSITDIDYPEPCTLLTNIAPHTGSCLSPDSHPHNLHSSSCSCGIDLGLVNNVHQGYVSSDEEDDDPDQNTITEESSQILRQWRRKKKLELQARQKESLAKQDRILEQAAIERENFYKDREAQIEAKKRFNRESERKYHADMESQQKLVEGNLWEAVAALIDLNGEIDRRAANRSEKSPKPSIVELSTPKKLEPKKPRDSPKPLKKSTDLSRMREILLKLQHQPLVRRCSRGGDMNLSCHC